MWKEVGQILAHALQKGDNLYISVGSFYMITYLTERYLKADQTLTKEERIAKLRLILNSILGTFKLANQSAKSMSDGINDELFDDLEDSYQAHVAEGMLCDVLLTINDKHFARYAVNSSIQVMNPRTFLETYLGD